MPRIGELLIAEGVLSEVAVRSALGFQRHTGEPFRLGTILLDRDLLGEESLLKALAAIHRCDYATWPQILKAGPKIARILPERAAVRLGAIPYALEGRGIRVAFKNPSNLAAVDEVSALTSRPVLPAVISEIRLLQALNLYFGRPVPIEFRNVLQKLERNTERRLSRSRGVLPDLAPKPASPPPPPPNPYAPPRRDHAKEIPISVGDHSRPAPRPVGYAAPFDQAEAPHPSEVAEGDASGFLPDFTLPSPETPEELAARMWKDAVPGETAVESVAAPEPAPAAPSPAPAAPTTLSGIPPPSGRDHIAENALDTLAARFPRIVLLLAGQDAVQGWSGRGGRLTRSRVSRVRIPWGEPSIFAFVKLSGSPHKGALSRILLPPALAEILGDRATAACAVFPVRIKDRLIAFLYADRAGAPMSNEDYRTLEAACSTLGSSLAKLLLELRKAAPAS
jgi:MshEN domain